MPLLVTGGVLAGVGVVIGGTLLGLGLKAGSDSESEGSALGGTSPCGAGTPFTTECADIADLDGRYTSFTIGGAIALGLGAAFGVATLTYAVIPAGQSTKGPAEPSVSILPIVDSNVLGAVVIGAF